MNKPSIKNISLAENPERFTGLKLYRPEKVAGGIKAVVNSMRHIFGAMDLARGWKALKIGRAHV